MLFRIALVALVALALATSAAAQTPADTLEFSETSPELVGGLARLQQDITYPAADREAGRQGTVIIRFVVTTQGEAAAVEVVRSVSPGLDSASVAALQQARFLPGTQNGQPVNVRMTIPIRFAISAPAAAPEQSSLDSDVLLNGLGQPWSSTGMPTPDADEPVVGGRRLVWRAPDQETEQIAADVLGDTLRVLTVTARAGSPALVSLGRLAAAIAAERVQTGPDGYFTARELGFNGVPSRVDIAFDLAARTWRFRAPPCPAPTSCGESPPVLLGGIRAFQRGIRYPRFAAETETSGLVVARFEVGVDGQVRDVTLDGESSGLPETALRHAALRAVAASRWTPATRDGRPVAVRTTLPVRFSMLQDWRD